MAQPKRKQTANQQPSRRITSSLRRRSITRFASRTIRELETLQETAANRATIVGMADALALWVHYMITQVDPTAAAEIYGALNSVWRDYDVTLTNLDGSVRDDDSRRSRIVDFHRLFVEFEQEAFGREPHRPTYPDERRERWQFVAFMGEQLRAIFERLPGAKEAIAQTQAKCERDDKIAELRTRLDKLTDITDESERFRIERAIFDLEHAPTAEEWPDVIGA